MKALRRATGPLAAAGRLVRGRAASGGAAVLCYHDVVAGQGGQEVSLDLNVSVGQLRRHLGLVRRLGYRFVSLPELTARAAGRQPVDGLLAVTFDDALAGVARHAVPLLVELEVPATIFAVSSVWGNHPPWWAGSGPTMTREELLEAHAVGMTVASHTRTHPSLPTLTAGGLDHELAGSRSELEDLVQVPVQLLAYPFGHHDSAVRGAAAAAGYVAAYTFLNGRVTGTEDRLRLPRFTMGRHHDRRRLAYHLSRAPESWPDHQQDRVTGEG